MARPESQHRSPGEAAPSPERALKTSTIVMVDDEPTTLDVVGMFLEDEGYENLVKVDDSTQALETIFEKRADLVLLDLGMPGIGGLEILRLMRADDDLAQIPVIILSSTSSSEAKLEALERGAADFLAKPVDPSELYTRVRNVLTYKAYEKRFGHLDMDASHQFVARMDRALRGDDPPIRSRLAGKPGLQPTIEKFVARLHEKLEWMEARFEAEDYDALAVLAQWLKGSAGMVGFDAFCGPADTLEILAKEGKREAAAGALRELNSLADRIVVDDGGAA
jgi:CheY-like chemotaxis protein